MREPLSPWFLLAIVPLVLLVAYFLWKQHKARVAAWAEFAARHDMRSDGLEVEGSYEGYALRLETQQRGAREHRHTVTVLRLSVNEALPSEFTLEREGLGDKLLQALGKSDDELGDPEFDRRFTLDNLSEETASLLRHPAVQEHLYAMLDLYRDFEIRGGWIQAERRDVPSSADELEDFTGPALMLVHTLEEHSRRSRRRRRTAD